MKIIKSIIFFAAICSVAVSSQLASANSPEVKKTANYIKSVREVKEEIREYISVCRESGCSGFGMHSMGVRICQLTQALDIRVNGKISGKRLSNRRVIPISKSDVNLMRMILSQCKWRSHLERDPADFVYTPTSQMGRRINKQLGIKL